jgi:UDP-2,3-diacylglucosamine pyrophosphatase LpxH
MLVIISDLHLGDGTTAESIPASAFYLFAKRLRQDAHFASLRNGKYHPIEELDIILMGDILDPLHSTKWMFPAPGEEEYVRVGDQNLVRITEPGEKNYVRPWSDPKDPKFAQKLLEVTRSILDYNKEALEVLRKLAAGDYIDFDPIDENGERVYQSQGKTHLPVRFHYMVGNHDWYYHLEGEAFDRIRQEIIAAMGLCNPPTPFPFDLRKVDSNYSWKADEYPAIERLFRDYKVFARHGDCFDTFNFDIEKGRNYSTLGDAFTMEVCNRYPEQLKRTSEFTQEVVDNMRHITNIRPALATPLWVTGQLRKLSMQNKLEHVRETDLKSVWDELADNFLNLDLVREANKAFEFDMVDKMSLAIKISKVVSLDTIDNLVFRLQNRNTSSGDRSFARFALLEPAFMDNTARYIVYGHTHFHETIPLDYDDVGGNQIYFNSGTWHTYFDLARKDPTEKKFIPYKALTYITFYKDDEHDERHFETWSGAYA